MKGDAAGPTEPAKEPAKEPADEPAKETAKAPAVEASGAPAGNPEPTEAPPVWVVATPEVFTLEPPTEAPQVSISFVSCYFNEKEFNAKPESEPASAAGVTPAPKGPEGSPAAEGAKTQEPKPETKKADSEPDEEPKNGSQGSAEHGK